MEHHPEKWGAPLPRTVARPTTRHGGPVVTGTSVLAVVYADGVMLAADTLASYGSLARFRGQQRIVPLGPHAVLGSAGDAADFQATVRALRAERRAEDVAADGHALGAAQWLTLVASTMYAKRSSMQPLWNTHVVAGVDSATGAPTLGAVDVLGTTWEAPSVATGYGAYIAQPLLRAALEERAGTPLTEADARALLARCMAVLWYRDARSSDSVQFARVTREGTVIEAPVRLAQSWDVAHYAFAPTD